MECSVVDVGLDDYATTLSEKIVISRIDHICGECRKAIKKGDSYKVENNIFEGSISTYKTCLDCLSIRNVFFTDGWFFGNIRDEIHDFIFECFGDISQASISSLTPGARSWVCDEIQEYWEQYEDDTED